MEDFSIDYFSNLDEMTRSVYKENVRITAALEYHVVESKGLKKVKRYNVFETSKDLEQQAEYRGLFPFVV